MRVNSEKMKMVGERAIAFFDLDGTLIETDAANSAAYRAALRECGRGMAGEPSAAIESAAI